MKPIRKLAIAILNDNYGIPEQGWKQLKELLEQEGNNDDLINAVDASEGRFFIAANWNT